MVTKIEFGILDRIAPLCESREQQICHDKRQNYVQIRHFFRPLLKFIGNYQNKVWNWENSKKTLYLKFLIERLSHNLILSRQRVNKELFIHTLQCSEREIWRNNKYNTLQPPTKTQVSCAKIIANPRLILIKERKMCMQTVFYFQKKSLKFPCLAFAKGQNPLKNGQKWGKSITYSFDLRRLSLKTFALLVKTYG